MQENYATRSESTDTYAQGMAPEKNRNKSIELKVFILKQDAYIAMIIIPANTHTIVTGGVSTQ